MDKKGECVVSRVASIGMHNKIRVITRRTPVDSGYSHAPENH